MWGRFTHLHLRLQRARNIQVVMCGRYAANRDTGTLTEVFKLKNLPSQLLTENYNISPTSKTYAITVDKNQNRTLEIMTWGLIPSWAKDNSMSAKMITAFPNPDKIRMSSRDGLTPTPTCLPRKVVKRCGLRATNRVSALLVRAFLFLPPI